MFVASLFGTAAITAALIQSVGVGKIGSDTYQFGHRVSDALFNLFAMKMAGVFIFSTCTIGLRTAIIPRWVAFTGYACGLVLLLVIANWKWITLVFPIWMLMMSTQILLSELRSRVAAQRTGNLSAARSSPESITNGTANRTRGTAARHFDGTGFRANTRRL